MASIKTAPKKATKPELPVIQQVFKSVDDLLFKDDIEESPITGRDFVPRVFC